MRTTATIILFSLTALIARAQAPVPPIPHIETAGQGDTTLLLIHNTQADWQVWRSFIQRNADRYTMLAPRLAGMGGSQPMPLPQGDPLDQTPWTDAAVEALAQTLAARDDAPVVAVGHGLGGAIAIRLATDHPELVKSVVLVDTMPAHPLTLDGYPLTDTERSTHIASGFAKATAELDPLDWRVRWRAIAGRQTTDEAEAQNLRDYSDLQTMETWRRWTLEQHVPDLTDELRQSGVPVVAAAAVNSGMISLLNTRVMVEEFWRLAYDNVPNAQISFFDETSYYIFLDRPDAFDALVHRAVAGETQPVYAFRETAEPEPAK